MPAAATAIGIACGRVGATWSQAVGLTTCGVRDAAVALCYPN